MDVLKDALAFLRRLTGPENALPDEGEHATSRSEFAELLSEVGSEAPAADDDAFSLKDQAIDELRRNLEALQPLGNRLAETERRREATATRVQDLERGAAALLAELTSAEVMRSEVERLHKELEQARSARLEEREEATRVVARLREELLAHAVAARERVALERELRASQAAARRLEKSLATARRKHEERHRVATERWQDLRALRAEHKATLKRLAALEARKRD